jgi:hypothetical protein
LPKALIAHWHHAAAALIDPVFAVVQLFIWRPTSASNYILSKRQNDILANFHPPPRQSSPGPMSAVHQKFVRAAFQAPFCCCGEQEMRNLSAQQTAPYGRLNEPPKAGCEATTFTQHSFAHSQVYQTYWRTISHCYERRAPAPST